MQGHPGSAEDERSDADLLAAHVDGDPDAFAVLFTRHRDRLWAVALRTMGDPTDAADGLQDGLIAAYRRAGSFRGDSAVTTWLHRVIVNACLDRLRAGKVRAADPLGDTPEEVDRTVASAPDATRGPGGSPTPVDPADQAVRSDTSQRVVEALRTLEPDQRAALVLVDLEGHRVAEAAEILGCAEGTVKSRCARARRRIAPLLADLVGP